MKNFLLLLLMFAFPASLFAGGPGKGYKIFPDDTFVPPDKSFRIEQFANEDWMWQIWVFPPSGKDGYQLTGPDEEIDYAAFFEASADSTWLLRSQKIGSGTNTAFLYHREKGGNFSPLKEGELGDLAWKFFATRPGMTKDQVPTFHQGVEFVRWDGDRYLILVLSGMNGIEPSDDGSRWVTHGWYCAFDLEKREFILLPDQAEANKGKIVKMKNGES